MQRIFPIILIFFNLLLESEKVTLYDAEIKSTEGINGFTSINIFSSGGTDEVWGNSNKLCNPMSFSSMDASIDYSLNNMGSSNIESTKADFKVDLPTVKVKDKKGIEKILYILKQIILQHVTGLAWELGGMDGKEKI